MDITQTEIPNRIIFVGSSKSTLIRDTIEHSPHTLHPLPILDVSPQIVIKPDDLAFLGQKYWNSMIDVRDWLLNPEERHPPLHGLNPDNVSAQINRTITTALSKTRGLSPLLCQSYQEGHPKLEGAFIVRDTAQLFHPRDSKDLVYQSHPGNDIEAQRAQAVQLVRADYVILVTVHSLVAVNYPTRTPNDVAHALEGLTYLVTDVGKERGFTSAGLINRSRADGGVAVFRFSPDFPPIGSLPREAFVNRPGGLNFDHPLVRQNLIIALTLGKAILPLSEAEKYLGFKEIADLADWRSLLRLSEKEQTDFILTYQGLIRQPDFDRLYTATISHLNDPL